MKVEAAKNNSSDKKEPKNVYKTEKSVYKPNTNPLKTVEAPTTGAFAKILEESRKQRDELPTAKTSEAESDAKTLKYETDEKISRVADEKKEMEERDSRDGNADARQNGEENQLNTSALAALQTQKNSSTEINAPAARSILHIADLERIVSSIRTETFQNHKQVIIALKNSVLQGLQIKLTMTENGKVKAEFLSGSEAIKKQLKQRKNELKKILGNRSTLVAEVEIN